jgi:uncharacterized protein (TIGR00255 family)
MTAYARINSDEVSGLSWVCEIHSVNQKPLQLHLHLSKELLFLDLELRKMITDSVKRGQVNVRLHLKNSVRGIHSLDFLKKLKKEWGKVAKELAFDPEDIDLTFLLDQAGRFSLENVIGPRVQKSIKATLKKALELFVKMKLTEGKALTADLAKHLKAMMNLTDQVEKTAAAIPENYKKKLVAKLALLIEGAEQDERVLREIALIGEKMDVTEEVVRLRSHINQMKGLLSSKEVSIGRTLDFLTQEMLREINTIGSKSHDLEITKLVVEGKGEMEKIREQVQNIE